MEKIHMIGWGFLLIVLGASATTFITESVVEAQSKLGTIRTVEQTGCYVYGTTKIATTQDEILNKDWTVSYELKYKIDQKDLGEERITTVQNNTESVVKAKIEKLCDAEWADVLTQNQIIDKVLIRPTNNPVLNQFYNVTTKTWSNLTTQGA